MSYNCVYIYIYIYIHTHMLCIYIYMYRERERDSCYIVIYIYYHIMYYNIPYMRGLLQLDNVLVPAARANVSRKELSPQFIRGKRKRSSGKRGPSAIHMSKRSSAKRFLHNSYTIYASILHNPYEEFTRLAETRLAQSSLDYLEIAQTTLK